MLARPALKLSVFQAFGQINVYFLGQNWSGRWPANYVCKSAAGRQILHLPGRLPFTARRPPTMQFYKYQGTGNDFVMLDQREQQHLARTDVAEIARLCDRRFGIGADGVILLENHPDFDFEMVYFNSDGSQSFCGNGGRCTVAFAQHLGAANGETCHFLAIDGPHEARFSMGKTPNETWVELKMRDVSSIETAALGTYILNTGSPHFVRFVPDLAAFDMVQEGRAVRYSERFRAEGINVNLATVSENGIQMQTYERGVEDETLSCGTGVTAAALAHFLHSKLPPGRAEIPVKTRGGDLAVRFVAHANGSFSDVWLCGPAVRVFSGNI